MPSVLNVDTLTNAAGTGPVGLTSQVADRYYGRWDGSSTYSVNSSLNQSSVTDNTNGASTVTFTNNFADTTYAPFAFASNDRAQRLWAQMDGNFGGTPNDYGKLTTSTFGFFVGDEQPTVQDVYLNTARIVGDLA
jgi:hypothetical protein